jgi:hypothetical protein
MKERIVPLRCQLGIHCVHTSTSYQKTEEIYQDIEHVKKTTIQIRECCLCGKTKEIKVDHWIQNK